MLQNTLIGQSKAGNFESVFLLMRERGVGLAGHTLTLSKTLEQLLLSESAYSLSLSSLNEARLEF